MTAPVKLAGLHSIGNAFLMLLGYYWLGLGESDAIHLAFSAAVILVAVSGTIWLHATALVSFRSNTSVGDSAMRVVSNLLPLWTLAVIACLIYVLLTIALQSFGHAAFTLGSYTTMKIRRPVAPDNILKSFRLFVWFVRWFVIPAFLLPIASQVATYGWAGFRRSAFRKTAKILFWVKAGLSLLAAIELPLYLFLWIPRPAAFSLEVASFVMRIGIGYLVLTAGFLLLEYFTSTGNPPTTQRSTSASP